MNVNGIAVYRDRLLRRFLVVETAGRLCLFSEFRRRRVDGDADTVLRYTT